MIYNFYNYESERVVRNQESVNIEEEGQKRLVLPCDFKPEDISTDPFL